MHRSLHILNATGLVFASLTVPFAGAIIAGRYLESYAVATEDDEPPS